MKLHNKLVWLASAVLSLALVGCGGAEDDAGSGGIGGTTESSATETGAEWDSTLEGGEASAPGASPEGESFDPAIPEVPGNTQVNFGGAQDFGFIRALLDNNTVPEVDQLDPAGFIAEHSTPLPDPECGEQLCVHGMLGVMANLINGVNCTLLQVGLNSPITVDVNDRPPLSLAVVVDTSGSMSADNKLGFVREGLNKLINELSDDDMISLVTYSTGVQVDFPMAEVKGNRNELQDIAAALEAVGSTNLYDGLEMGFDQVRENYDSGRQNRVILLSDGLPTIGILNDTQIVDMSSAYNSDGIGLTTVGIGTDFNVDLMQTLAEQADGNYYFLESAAAVDEVFTEELAYFTVPVGFDVSIRISTGEAYQFLGARGSHLFEENDNGGKIDIPSVFLAHRLAHDDVTEDGGKRGGGSALLLELMPDEDFAGQGPDASVATIEFEFREPGSDEIITQYEQIIYPYPSDELLTAGHFDNAIVTKSFVMLNIYVAFEMACQLFHQGESSEAVGILERLIAAAIDYEDDANDGEGDLDIVADIELMEQLRDVIEANTPSMETPDPEIPEDPWPAD